MPPITTQTLTQRDMATVLGVDPRTVRDLSAQGVLPRHPSGSYVLVQAVRAYIAHRLGKAAHTDEEALDYNREKARLTHHQADRARLRYDRESGVLVEEAQVRLALEHVLTPLRQAVLGLEVSLPPKLQGATAAEQRATLARELRTILAALARPEIRYADEIADTELDGPLLADDPEESATGAGDTSGVPVPGAAP